MFKYTICEPLNPNILEKGFISKEDFIQVLNEFPWLDMLNEQTAADESSICYSPSLELVNTNSNHGLAISIIEPNQFYIFYKRPKMITKRKWFKSVEIFEPDYLSERLNQTEKDMRDAFNALLNNDLTELESRWG
nr:hypothetical protein [uncultured Fluviicola sp.]